MVTPRLIDSRFDDLSRQQGADLRRRVLSGNPPPYPSTRERRGSCRNWEVILGFVTWASASCCAVILLFRPLDSLQRFVMALDKLRTPEGND